MKNRFEMFTNLISKINQQIRRIKMHEVAEFGLKSSHVECLYYLFKYGELTSTELCGYCDEDKASISRSVLNLTNNGYIKCADGKGRRKYRSHLTLTEKGMLVGKSISEKIDKVLFSSSSGLTEEQRQSCYYGLEVISKNLQSICDKY